MSAASFGVHREGLMEIGYREWEKLRLQFNFAHLIKNFKSKSPHQGKEKGNWRKWLGEATFWGNFQQKFGRKIQRMASWPRSELIRALQGISFLFVRFVLLFSFERGKNLRGIEWMGKKFNAKGGREFAEKCLNMGIEGLASSPGVSVSVSRVGAPC